MSTQGWRQQNHGYAYISSDRYAQNSFDLAGPQEARVTVVTYRESSKYFRHERVRKVHSSESWRIGILRVLILFLLFMIFWIGS